MIASSAAMALGWAIYVDQLAASLKVDTGRRADLDAYVFSLISEMGGLPDRQTDASDI